MSHLTSKLLSRPPLRGSLRLLGAVRQSCFWGTGPNIQSPSIPTYDIPKEINAKQESANQTASHIIWSVNEANKQYLTKSSKAIEMGGPFDVQPGELQVMQGDSMVDRMVAQLQTWTSIEALLSSSSSVIDQVAKGEMELNGADLRQLEAILRWYEKQAKSRA